MNNSSDILSYVLAIGGIVLFVLCYAKALTEVKAPLQRFVKNGHSERVVSVAGRAYIFSLKYSLSLRP